jgi:hypothetical protein
MFQGVDQYYIGGAVEVPDRIVVELDPKVSGTSEQYPLTAPTRERLKSDTKVKIGRFIQSEIVDAAAKKRNDEVVRIYNKLDKAPASQHVIYDGGERYTPEEIQNIKDSKEMNTIGNIIKSVTNELASTIPTTRTISRTGFIFDKLRGVNLKSPEDPTKVMVMINPFSAIENNSPREAAQGMVHIILHEFTHVNVRSEGSEYTAHLATVYEKFDLERQINARNKVLKVITGGKWLKG